jgi:signal transduction histidine kinase
MKQGSSGAIWAVLAVFAGANAILLVPSPLPASFRVGIPTVIYLVLLAGSALAAFRRARQEPANRWGWFFLALFFGMVTFSLAAALHHQVTEGFFRHQPPLAHLTGWTLSLLLVAISLLGFHGNGVPPTSRWGALLDGAIFATALYLLFWMWVLKPLLPLAVDAQTRLLLQLLFLLIACSLGLASHALIARRVAILSPLGAFTLAFVYFALFVPFWAKAILDGSYHVFHPSRTIGVPFWALLWWATQTPWPRQPSSLKHRIWLLLLPYLPGVLAFAGALLTYLPAQADRDSFGIGLLSSLALLVLSRQGLVLKDFWELNRNLESKVEARTEELAQTQALVLRTQRMNLLATLGAGLAHDINNLLSAALGYLGLAMESGDPQTGRDLDRLGAALVRAGELTQRMMAAGRPEGPGMVPLDLSAHLRGLEPVLRAFLPKAMTLTMSVPDRPLQVRAQGVLMDQILVNLVGNARDATPPEGRIAVRLSPGGLGAILEVEDNGSGISHQVRERLFEAFFTTKEAGKGTGLGLGSVKAVVEGLQGSIQVHSELGRGSVFHIELPLSDPSGEA